MTLYPCSACGERPRGKLASVTWAWWRVDNQRTAWRQRLCTACYVDRVLTLQTAVEEEPLSCPLCHTDPGEAMDPCYATTYVPGIGKQQIELATCGVCAAMVRIRAQENALHLDDRLNPVGGQDPGPQPDPSLSSWASIGIAPRE